jgi:hypothetical protein
MEKSDRLLKLYYQLTLNLDATEKGHIMQRNRIVELLRSHNVTNELFSKIGDLLSSLFVEVKNKIVVVCNSIKWDDNGYCVIDFYLKVHESVAISTLGELVIRQFSPFLLQDEKLRNLFMASQKDGTFCDDSNKYLNSDVRLLMERILNSIENVSSYERHDRIQIFNEYKEFLSKYYNERESLIKEIHGVYISKEETISNLSYSLKSAKKDAEIEKLIFERDYVRNFEKEKEDFQKCEIEKTNLLKVKDEKIKSASKHIRMVYAFNLILLLATFTSSLIYTNNSETKYNRKYRDLFYNYAERKLMEGNRATFSVKSEPKKDFESFQTSSNFTINNNNVGQK